jgi:hypothetical protein
MFVIGNGTRYYKGQFFTNGNGVLGRIFFLDDIRMFKKIGFFNILEFTISIYHLRILHCAGVNYESILYIRS